MNFNDVVAFAQKYPEILGAAVGLVLSLLATQTFKFFVPPSVADWTYKTTVRAFGVLSGFGFGYGAWRIFDPGSGRFQDVFFALAIGCASPAIYSIGVPLLVKWKPDLEKVLSGRPGV